MSRMSHWLAPIVFGVATAGASLMPAIAHAQSGGDLIRILVNSSDVIYRSGNPYYRHGNAGYNDRLVVVRDRYGRPVYYRNAPRHGSGYATGYGAPYGNAYGHRAQRPAQQTRCDRQGRCTTRYYDPRYDRDGRLGQYDNRYYGNRHPSGYWSGRR